MKVTLSQDILGLCLVLSGGDLDMRLSDLAKLAEGFQEDSDRHFGITRNDFCMLLMRLLWEKVPSSIFRGESILDDVKLREVTLDMLKYQDAGFNDEGEYWASANTPGTPREPDHYYNEYLYILNLTPVEYELKTEAKKLMVEFFEGLQGKSCPVRQVLDLMVKTGLTDDLLYACSTSGAGG